MSQNISNRKTFHSFNCGSWSWWRCYWAFAWIHNAFETLQRTKIIVTISTTIIFRWQLLFYWRWTWCSNRYFRTSWTCWRWCVCCTQHICCFFVSLFKNHHKSILQNLIDWSKCTQCLIAHANTFLELFLFLLSLHLQHKLFFMSTRLVWAGSLNFFSLAYCQNQPNKGSIGFKYEIHFIVLISHKLSMLWSINCFKWRIFHQCHTVMYKVTNTILFIKFC